MATLTSDGTVASVQSLHDLPGTLDGDIITIPAGTFIWTTTLTITKAVKLQGAGSGRIITQSASPLTVGTGIQTLTVEAGLSIIAADTLRIAQLGNRTNFMEGTVTSYTATTLILNATSSGGSGTHNVWVISTPPTTTITHAVAGGPSIELIESTAGSIEVSGIKIVYDSGSLNVITIGTIPGGSPVLIHDCWGQQLGGGDSIIRSAAHRGVVWDCSFDAQWLGSGQAGCAFVFTDPSDSTGSWTTDSTMGMDDTDGDNNFYVEDCDFHAYLNSTDFSDASRTVMRHCLFNNAGLGSHGPDSAVYGNRHFEVYDNTFVFNGFSDGSTLNLNWWLFLRGGTGVWTDNEMPWINSSDYPSQATYKFTVMALRRSGSMQPAYACWAGGYPLPREIGQGYVTGSPATEPLYIWNNTGTAPQTPTFDDINCADGEACVNCVTQPITADFILSGRDYFIGTPKPGYTKFTYPHPLTEEEPEPEPEPEPEESADTDSEVMNSEFFNLAEIGLTESLATIGEEFTWQGNTYPCILDYQRHSLVTQKSLFSNARYPKWGELITVAGKVRQVTRLNGAALLAASSGGRMVENPPFTDDPADPSLVIEYDVQIK